VVFSPQVSNPVHTFSLHRTCYMPSSSHSSRFDYLNNIGCGAQVIKLFIVYFSPLPCHPVPLQFFHYFTIPWLIFILGLSFVYSLILLPRDQSVPVTTAWRVLRLRMEERPAVWRVATYILNKQSRTADKGWSSSLGVGRGANNFSL
jgi:hypothetical protein